MYRFATVLAALVLGVSQASAALSPVTAVDHVRNSPNARISMVVYGDFEDPFTQRHLRTLKQLDRKYRGKVNWVFRHYPLEFHPGAFKKAVASECVATLKNNRAFWRFHDLLFRKSTGNPFPVDKLPQLARSMGVPTKEFQVCMTNGVMDKRVILHTEEITAAGVNGTPHTLLIDHRTGIHTNITGAYPLASFTKIIDSMLAGTWTGDAKPLVPPPSPAPPEPSIEPVPAPSAADHTRGNMQARYAFILYGEAEGPFVRRFYPDVQKLQNANTDLKLVYRHYPLNFHPHSRPAAEAMECATEQGGNAAFWAYADAIYTYTEKLDQYGSASEIWDYVGIAKAQGLDAQRFQSCLDDDRHEALITAQFKAGEAAGVNGTPGSFLYDTKTGRTQAIAGAVPYETIKTSLEGFRTAP